MKFFFFVLQFMAVLCGAHFLLHLSVVRFFSIGDPSVKRILAWFSVLLSVSFIPSAILVRLFPGPLTRLGYIFSSTWLGLFVYLLMATALCWLVFLFGKFFCHGVPNMRIISAFGFVLAVLVSCHGLWCALHPEVRAIDISIKNLPAVWRGKKIVQLSDVHLGTINRAGFMQRVADQINRIEPDLVLITGDLFDGMGGDLNDYVAVLNRLSAAKGVYFVTGNHEIYLGLNRPLSILSQTQIRVLDNEVVDLEGLQIVGIGYPDHRLHNHARRLLTTKGAYDPDKPGILMYHTPTDIAETHMDRGSQQTKTYWRPETRFSLAKEAGIDLQLSGHTHRGQLFPFNLLTRILYNGYDYGLHQDGDFQIYISTGTGTWGPPLRVGVPAEIVVITFR